MSRLSSMAATGQQIVQAAGAATAVDDESTQRCMTFEERPPTPEHVKVFRKSYFAEPGKRVLHYGRIKDEEAKQREWEGKSAEQQAFGRNKVESLHVPDVVKYGPQSTMAEKLNARKEAVYHSTRREPLGKSRSHGQTVPAHMLEPGFRFGEPSVKSESAKELVAPPGQAEDPAARDLYRRSHRSYEPGEQKRRGYVVPGGGDVRDRRFGIVDTERLPDGEGARLCLNPGSDPAVDMPRVTTKRVEEFKATQPRLGRVRNIMQEGRAGPGDETFGVSTAGRGEWSAADCIAGGYSEAEQMPDADLGRSRRPGWRNAAPETRAFGVPSIRADVPQPRVKSVADPQNYGDDSTASELLYPSRFAVIGIRDEDFLANRNVEELRDLFESIGYKLDDGTFKRVYWRAASFYGAEFGGQVGVEQFRRALNEVDDARHAGEDPKWWAAAGAATEGAQ